MSQSAGAQGCYKIKTIAALAGVSPSLLRAWERRYQLFSPSRQSGNQRLYSPEDLAVLRQIQFHLGQGLTIGEVAALGRARLLAAAEHPIQPERPDRPALPNLSIQPSRRFDGRHLGVSLIQLSPQDLVTVQRIYNLVKGVYELWTYMRDQFSPELLVRRMDRLDDPEFLLDIRGLGATTSSKDPLVVAAIVDSKAGALAHLIRIRKNSVNPSAVTIRRLTSLARDHAKVLRNAFFDLDIPLRGADEVTRVHDVSSFVRKVQELNPEAFITTDYSGPLTGCCLETSTLDRVLYDFSHRTGWTGGSATELKVSRQGDLLRWDWTTPLKNIPGFSTRDYSCLAVAEAVGLSTEQAMSQGVLGLQGGSASARAWFHWPIYSPSPGDSACACDSEVHSPNSGSGECGPADWERTATSS